MRKLLITVAIITAIASTPALAQSSGPGASDISKSDMGAHDYASQPKDAYDLRNQLRNDEAMKEARAGASINDKTGILIARIEKVDPDGVVVTVGTAKVKVPADAFGHNNLGLLLDMTKAQFDQVVAQTNTTH